MPKPPHPPVLLLSGRTITVVVAALVALLALVIVVGLARKQLDPTGVAVMLGATLSGVVTGALLRGKDKGGDG